MPGLDLRDLVEESRSTDGLLEFGDDGRVEAVTELTLADRVVVDENRLRGGLL